jgi:hypothetical protein
MLGECIASALELLGFLRTSISVEIGQQSFPFISLCVHGTVVFLFSCKVHLAAYTAGQILLIGEVD